MSKSRNLKLSNAVNVDNSDENDDAFPLPPTPNTRTNLVAYTISDHAEMSVGYFDLTGRFPQKIEPRK